MNQKFIVTYSDREGELTETLVPSKLALSALLDEMPKEWKIVKVRVLDRFRFFTELMDELRKKTNPRLVVGKKRRK